MANYFCWNLFNYRLFVLYIDLISCLFFIIALINCRGVGIYIFRKMLSVIIVFTNIIKVNDLFLFIDKFKNLKGFLVLK